MLFVGNKFVMIDNNHWPHCVIIRNKGRTGRGKKEGKRWWEVWVGGKVCALKNTRPWPITTAL